MEEIWKDIQGFEGYYKVSNLGRVISVARVVYFERKDGATGQKTVKECILSPRVDKDGYLEFSLSREGKATFKRGHRLVAETFIPKVAGCDVIDHIDNIKDNNKIDNLRWVTATQNTILYYDMMNKGLSTMTHDQWCVAKEMYLDGHTYQEITDYFGLSVKNVQSMSEVMSCRRLSSISGFTEDIRLNNRSGNISDEDGVNIIKDSIIHKLTCKDLVRKYKCTKKLLNRVISGDSKPSSLKTFRERYGDLV